MKKLIYITLTLVLFYGIHPEVSAWVNNDVDQTVVDKAQNGSYVGFRLDPFNKIAHVVFYGPAYKLGENVEVKIFHGGTGALLLQEFVVAHGGSERMDFSIDDLEAGPYAIVVTSERYNLSQPFILE